MKYLYLFGLSLVLLSTALFADSPKIVINNCILTKVNGKAITLMDVAKKMDLILLRQFPEEFSSVEARFQFYRTNWQGMLSDLIDRELIMQKAEEVNFPVTAGDIRQELEEIFGPNVLMNIENSGLTFDEVWQMIRSDIIIRRMLMWEVTSRVYAGITPQEVRALYEEYLAQNNHDEFSYRMISFRGEDAKKAMLLAKQAHELLTVEKISIDTIKERLQENQVTVSLSETYTQKQDVLAKPIQEALLSLQAGSYSLPLTQKSRMDNSSIIRIYYLQEKKKATPLPFSEMEATLKDDITKRRLAKDTEAYFAKLRKHFDIKIDEIHKELAVNFDPFVIQQ